MHGWMDRRCTGRERGLLTGSSRTAACGALGTVARSELCATRPSCAVASKTVVRSNSARRGAAVVVVEEVLVLVLGSGGGVGFGAEGQLLPAAHTKEPMTRLHGGVAAATAVVVVVVVVVTLMAFVIVGLDNLLDPLPSSRSQSAPRVTAPMACPPRAVLAPLTSSYFSPNIAVAPAARASSIAISRVVSGVAPADHSFTSCSTCRRRACAAGSNA
eukprot:221965-Chlamydomonas_euryale.AAC.3